MSELTVCDTLVIETRQTDRQTLKGFIHMGWKQLSFFMIIFSFSLLEDEPITAIAQQEGGLTCLIIKILITILLVILCGLVISIINL